MNITEFYKTRKKKHDNLRDLQNKLIGYFREFTKRLFEKKHETIRCGSNVRSTTFGIV